MPNIHNNLLVTFTIGISAFGLFLVLIFAFNPPTIHDNFAWRKPLIGSLFSLICISGILAALLPKKCSKTFHFQKSETNFTSHKISATSKGHHPDCGSFSDHVMRIGSRTFCAACTGLLFGAIIAIIGTAFYFFDGWLLGEMNFLTISTGIIGLILGFFQLKFKGFVRLILNLFFVFGAFLILAGIDELARNLFIDSFLTALIVFWILTRILLSQWDHSKICSSCKSPCGNLVSTAKPVDGTYDN